MLAHSTGNELTRGTPELVLNLIWFGYITRLSQWGGGGNSIVLRIRSAPNVFLAHSPCRPNAHTFQQKKLENIEF